MKQDYTYIIGLDISTKMGVAVIDAGRSWRLTRIDGGARRGMDRALHMVKALHDFLTNSAPYTGYGFAVVEQPAYAAAGGKAHNVQNELNAVMRFSLYLKGIQAFTVAPNTLKKFATGNGRADKKEMTNAAVIALETHAPICAAGLGNDEADAYWLARFGWELVDDSGFNKSVIAGWAAKNVDQLEQAELFK